MSDKIKTITDLEVDYQQYIELKAYSDAQSKTLVEMSKKIKKLEDENKELKKHLMNVTPLIKSDSSKPNLSTTDEETICRQQIYKLKEISMDRELTLEETKRLDIYTKILIEIENKPKVYEVKSKNLSDNDLLLLASTEEKKNE